MHVIFSMGEHYNMLMQYYLLLYCCVNKDYCHCQSQILWSASTETAKVKDLNTDKDWSKVTHNIARQRTQLASLDSLLQMVGLFPKSGHDVSGCVELQNWATSFLGSVGSWAQLTQCWTERCRRTRQCHCWRLIGHGGQHTARAGYHPPSGLQHNILSKPPNTTMPCFKFGNNLIQNVHSLNELMITYQDEQLYVLKTPMMYL